MTRLKASLEVFNLAAEHLGSGGFVVLHDPTQDLGVVGILGDAVDASAVNFLVKQCRGHIYVGLAGPRLDHLGIFGQHVAFGGPPHHRIPVDVIDGATTGISARDRALTIQALLDPSSESDMFRQPGHVTPIGIHEAGSLGRIGLLDALADVANAVRQKSGVVAATVLDDTGEYADATALRVFAERHNSPFLSIADVLRAKRRSVGMPNDRWCGVQLLSLPLLQKSVYFRVFGEIELRQSMPVASLDLCIGGQIFDLSCSCGRRLLRASQEISAEGVGVVGLVARAERPLRGCPSPSGKSFHDGLTDILAAYVAGAMPAPRN